MLCLIRIDNVEMSNKKGYNALSPNIVGFCSYVCYSGSYFSTTVNKDETGRHWAPCETETASRAKVAGYFAKDKLFFWKSLKRRHVEKRGVRLAVLKPKKVDEFINAGVKINKGYGTRQNLSVTSGEGKAFLKTRTAIIKGKLATVY